MDTLRLIDDLKGYELDVNSVVITRYEDQEDTTLFIIYKINSIKLIL